MYQEDGADGTYITGIWAAQGHIDLVLGGVGVFPKKMITKTPILRLQRYT